MVYPETKRRADAEASLFMDCTLAQAWKILGDIAHPQAWDGISLQTQIKNQGDKKIGVGSRRSRDLEGGTHLEEEVIHWISGREYKMSWKNTALPIKDVTFLVRLVDAGRGRTLATFRLNYMARFWPLGAVLNYFVLRPQLEKMLASQLQGLSEACSQ